MLRPCFVHHEVLCASWLIKARAAHALTLGRLCLRIPVAADPRWIHARPPENKTGLVVSAEDVFTTIS